MATEFSFTLEESFKLCSALRAAKKAWRNDWNQENSTFKRGLYLRPPGITPTYVLSILKDCKGRACLNLNFTLQARAELG